MPLIASDGAQQVPIDVSYFGLIREVLGCTEETISVPVSTSIGEVMGMLQRRHGDSFRNALIAANGEPLPNAVIVLDGANILHRRGFDTEIRRACTVRILLLPPFTGGG